MTAPPISCGCEPLWPSGVDRSGCWWHSGAGLGDLAWLENGSQGDSVALSGVLTTRENGR